MSNSKQKHFQKLRLLKICWGGGVFFVQEAERACNKYRNIYMTDTIRTPKFSSIIQRLQNSFFF